MFKGLGSGGGGGGGGEGREDIVSKKIIHVYKYLSFPHWGYCLRWPTLISVAQRSAHCRHSTL